MDKLTDSEALLIATATGTIKQADETLRLLHARLSQQARALPKREHIEKARKYLADAIHRLDLAFVDWPTDSEALSEETSDAT